MFLPQQQQQQQHLPPFVRPPPAPASSPPSNGYLDETPDFASTLDEIARLTKLDWPAEAGKRPPRDMKRLDPAVWYVVCRVSKWGEIPALLLRALNHHDDGGFFKPPFRFFSYDFHVGDRLRVSGVGYSASRNKIAIDISIKLTPLTPVPESKRTWLPPYFAIEPPLSTKKKAGMRSSSGQGSTGGGKKPPKKARRSTSSSSSSNSRLGEGAGDEDDNSYDGEDHEEEDEEEREEGSGVLTGKARGMQRQQQQHVPLRRGGSGGGRG